MQCDRNIESQKHKVKGINFLGKRKTCRKTYMSKGQRPNVSSDNKFDLHGEIDRALFKVEARRKGKRVCYTVPNPNKQETNKKFIRVCYG